VQLLLWTSVQAGCSDPAATTDDDVIMTVMTVVVIKFIIFNKCLTVVLLTVKKLNIHVSKHNQILFIIQNYISRPILGHPQVHNWSSKHADEEIYIM